jgi:hypothetical protein
MTTFQTEKAAVDQRQALLPTSVMLADIPSPPTVTDENRNTYIDLRHMVNVT